MVIGNVVGLVMLVVSVLVVGLPLHFVGVKNEAVMALGASVLLVLVDLVYRQRRGSTAFSRAGGRLFFLPAWLIGGVMFVATIVDVVRR